MDVAMSNPIGSATGWVIFLQYVTWSMESTCSALLGHFLFGLLGFWEGFLQGILILHVGIESFIGFFISEPFWSKVISTKNNIFFTILVLVNLLTLAEANGVDDGVGFIENAALLTTIGVTCTKLVSSSSNVRKKKRKNNSDSKSENKRGCYKTGYSEEDLRSDVLSFCLSKEKYCTHWHKNTKRTIPRKTISERFNLCKLNELKGKENLTFQECAEIYDTWFTKKEKNRLDSLKQHHKSNEHLTDEEQKILLECCTILSACARGLTEGELLDIISGIVCEREDERQRIEPSIDVVYCLLQKYPDLRSKVRMSAALDPLWAAQASEETRATFFTKLNNYIEMLHSLKYLPETNYGELCASRNGLTRLYNMDEVAVDTTQHRNKVICSKEYAKRCFSITPEGDGKMNFHVSIALTTRADGKLNLFI